MPCEESSKVCLLMLPMELLSLIAQHVYELDLRTLARVSWRCRAIASSDKRFLLRIKVSFEPRDVDGPDPMLFEPRNIDELDNAAQLARANEIKEHAIRFKVPLEFKLCFSCILDRDDQPQDGFFSGAVDLANVAFDILADALPVVCLLELDVPHEYETAMHAALDRPAPLLRSCVMRRSGSGSRDWLSSGLSEPLHLADTTFHGYAPKLEDVSLYDVWLDSGPAWADVRFLRLTYSGSTPVQNVQLADVFPALRRLRVGVDANRHVAIVQDVPIQFRGLKLEHLGVVCDGSNPFLLAAVKSQMDLASIPIVVSMIPSLRGQAIWDGLREYHELILWAEGHFRMAVCPLRRHGSPTTDRKRPLCTVAFLSAPYVHPLKAIDANVAERLVQIRLSDEFTDGLVKMHEYMPVLTRISVKIVLRRFWIQRITHPPRRLKCPRLELIEIWSHHADAPDIPRDKVEYLGLVVGQAERTTDKRANVRLELTRVRLGDPLWHTTPAAPGETLNELFPNMESKSSRYDDDEWREMDVEI